jgi:hypothetical protein
MDTEKVCERLLAMSEEDRVQAIVEDPSLLLEVLEQRKRVRVRGLQISPGAEWLGYKPADVYELVGKLLQSLTIDGNKDEGTVSIVMVFGGGYRLQMHRAPRKCVTMGKKV